MAVLSKQFLMRLPRGAWRRFRRLAGKVVRRVVPRPKSVVFVFGGRTQYWPGMGSELYAQEEVFRNSVRESDALIQAITGRSVLANFEGRAGADFFDDELNVLLSIPVLQIALFDLWKSRGIYPQATLGVSLGEVIAIYASGGLSRGDALRVVAGLALNLTHNAAEYRVLYAQAGLEKGFELAALSPVWMEPIFEAGAQGVLFFCRRDEIKEATAFLSSQGIRAHIPHDEGSVPYHTSLIQAYAQVMTDFNKEVKPLPLTAPCYSCAMGRVWPQGSILDNKYWHELSVLPVRIYTAMRAAVQDGHTVFIQVGPHPFMKRELQQAANGAASLLQLDSMHLGKPECTQFDETYRQLKRLRRPPSTLQLSHEGLDWAASFRFSAPHVAYNPYPYFRALRARGPVHYLPSEGSWLVLDYDLIDEVLKKPQVFSSRLHQPFDALLLGADPPDHTVMRTLLQPLFAPAALSALGQFTEEEAQRLLKLLAQRTNFDLVQEFSLPLAQSVIAHFLGLDEASATELEAALGGHVYGLGYLQSLEDFCRQYLQSGQPTGGASALLLQLVADDRLRFEEAVRLLRMLWIAGTTTTSMLLSQSLYQLLKHPHLVNELQSDPALLHKFIEECLRLEAPESELRRIVTQPTELGGQSLPEGAIVMLALRAANRDERYFEDPDTIKLDRPGGRHLSFGGGYHYCLGVGMARTEARQALKTILPLLHEWQLDIGAATAYFPSPHFRGLAQLKVRHRKTVLKPTPAI